MIYGPRTLRMGHKSKGKNSVHNLRYRPRTRLVRGIYFVSKEKEQVRIVREDDSGKKDVIYCDQPVDLIVTLLKKLGGTASVNQLCQVTNDIDY